MGGQGELPATGGLGPASAHWGPAYPRALGAVRLLALVPLLLAVEVGFQRAAGVGVGSGEV